MPQSTRPISREQLLDVVDHTLLQPETTAAQCREFIRNARELGLRRACISPTLLTAVRELAAEHPALELVTVVGFPSGAHAAHVKALEAQLAINDGAAEVDVVANRAFIKAADYQGLAAELTAVREVTQGRILKVILETACLTDDEIRSACIVARDVGCDFVKTSTGFHPAGGASVRAVEIMSETVGSQLGIKASGGIRTADAASSMIEAGATRLGLSATAQILAEWDGRSDQSTLLPAEDDRY